MADTSYGAKVYRVQGGDTIVVKDGGVINVEAGGEIRDDDTQASHIADQKTDYGAGDLDIEAEIIAAFNATNAALNAVLAALEGAGILATS